MNNLILSLSLFILMFACGAKKEETQDQDQKITRDELINEIETNYNAFSNVKVGMHYISYSPNKTIAFGKSAGGKTTSFSCIVNLEEEKTVLEVNGNNYRVVIDERGKVLVGSDSRCNEMFSKGRARVISMDIIKEIKEFRTFDLKKLINREYFKKIVEGKTIYIVKGRDNSAVFGDNIYADITVEIDPTVSIIFNPRNVQTKVYLTHRNSTKLILEQESYIKIISE